MSPSGKAQDFIGSSKGKAREVQAEGGSVPLPMAMTPACEGSNPSTPAIKVKVIRNNKILHYHNAALAIIFN